MNDPDLWPLLLNAFFPTGIPPHQYENLAVLACDIDELYDLFDQISRTELHNELHGAARQDVVSRSAAEVKKEVTKEVTQSTYNVAVKPLQNGPHISSKPYIIGTYPSNFEEAPVEPIISTCHPKKRMGRPPREPGSLGLKCPKCGSSDVTAGGYGPNKERRIRCKACGSQPTVNSLEFEDLSPDEIEKYGPIIPAKDIEARPKELHTAEDA